MNATSLQSPATGCEMVSQKRKRSPVVSEASDISDVSSEHDGSSSGEDLDLSSALTGKKPRKTARDRAGPQDEDDDEDLQVILQESMSKRDVKEGTALLKKTKGKTKIVKGEIGGGSFQSMGSCFGLLQ